MSKPQKLEVLPDTGTVSVACKLPSGLVLDLPVGKDTHTKLPDGSVVPAPHREFVRLRGFSRHFGQPAPDVVGGYGITHNVDAAMFKRWWDLHTGADVFAPIKADLIFAMEKPEDAIARAKDQSSVESDLEPIVPNKKDNGVEKIDSND